MNICPCLYTDRTGCKKCYLSSGLVPENAIEEIKIDVALLRDIVEALPNK